jgi:hypothetical protein
MSDRFVVTTVKYRSRQIMMMEIRNRGTLELMHFLALLCDVSIESVSGRWALLGSFSRLPDGSPQNQLAVWDLERGVRCPGYIECSQTRYCFHQVDKRYATVYTAAEAPGETDVYEWALYQFSLDEPVKQLKKSHFHAKLNRVFMHLILCA